jgi:acyl carrier protein
MKQNIISEQKVFDVLKKITVDTLLVDEKIIKPETSLVNELDAESLDFLDINYQLERTFGIKMARDFVLELSEEEFGEGSVIDEDGKLTEAAVQLLRIRFGEQTQSLKAGMDIDKIPAIITIQSIVKTVLDMLDTLPESCSHCGQTRWATEDGTHIVCSDCGNNASFTNGTDLTIEWLKKIQKEHRIFTDR